MANILVCDLCGSKVKVETRYIYTGNEHMDASGNGYEKEYVVKDICSDCLDKVLAFAMGFGKNPLAMWRIERERIERIFSRKAEPEVNHV